MYFDMKKIFLSLIVGLFLITSVSAWGNSTFNNSLESENLTFVGDENITRWLSVPEDTVLTSGYLNLSGRMFPINVTDYGEAVSNYFLSDNLRITAQKISINTTIDKVGFVWACDESCDGNIFYQIRDEGNNLISECDMGTANDTVSFMKYCDFTPDVAISDSNYIGMKRNESGGDIVNVRFGSEGTTDIIGDFWRTTDNGTNWGILIANTDLITDIITTTDVLNNSYLEINDTKVWNYTGEYTTTEQTSNFASTINSYIETATAVAGYYLVPFIFHSDTAGILEYLGLTFNNEGFTENSQTYNSSTYETASETFSINITYDSNAFTSSAKLYYNGTEYTGTKSGTGNTISFYKVMDMAEVSSITNKTFYWTIKLTNSTGDYYYNSTTGTQTINPIYFGLCNGTYTDDFLNLTFQDESDSSEINASISTSSWEYYLGSGSITKTYDLINNTENYNYLFCATPNRTFHIDPYVQYVKTGYPQRIWNPSVTDYNSTLTTQILYLLGTSDGMYVTFQITNTADQVLSGVTITANRDIAGTDTRVGNGITGDDGTVTFWLNPNFIHTFTFSKTGYTTKTSSYAPTQTSYTVILSGESSSSNSYFQGIDYSIQPTSSYLVNDTEYTFAFNLTSSFWDVNEYGFSLRLSNGTTLSGGSTGTEGTNLELGYDTNNQTIIYMDYYWEVNGTYINATRIWAIQNTENTGWSIAYFFTDLKSYISSGLFGLDSFGLSLIIFFAIFLTSGVMSYKFGITSPMAITTLVFGIVFFFDVVVDIIPTIRGIDNLITYFASLVLVLVIFREVQNG